MNWPAVISGIVGLAGGGVAAFFGYLATRKTASVTDRQYISQDMRDTIERLDRENTEQRQELDAVKKDLDAERRKTLELEARVRELEWTNKTLLLRIGAEEGRGK